MLTKRCTRINFPLRSKFPGERGAKFYTQVKISFPFYINKIGFAPLKSGYVLRIVDGKLG